MPAAKVRKDGTRRSHGEWASANNFGWFSEDTIPDKWINVKRKRTLKMSIDDATPEEWDRMNFKRNKLGEPTFEEYMKRLNSKYVYNSTENYGKEEQRCRRFQIVKN